MHLATPIFLIYVFFFVITGVGVWLFILRIPPDQTTRKHDREDEGSNADTKGIRPPFWLALPLVIVGLLGIVNTTSSVYIGPKQVGVLENKSTGKLTVLHSGLHVFPFDLRVIPLVTKTDWYDTDIQTFEIGSGDTTNKNGIESTTNSEGQPSIFFHNRISVEVNPDKILDLHRKYGAEYINKWVQDASKSATKTVQGTLAYNYIVDHRADLESQIRAELENRLKLSTGETWVFTRQVVVINYDYTDEFNKSLAAIAAAKVKHDQLVAEQANATTQKETADIQYQSDAQKITRDANANAAKITTEASAQATAIAAINNALASAPAYNQYLQIQKWDGQLPTYYGGSGPIPFFNVPTVTSASSPTATPTPTR